MAGFENSEFLNQDRRTTLHFTGSVMESQKLHPPGQAGESLTFSLKTFVQTLRM